MSKPYKTLIVVFLLFCSCNITDESIIAHSWKYEDGYHIGDWIEFKGTNYTLLNDTIFIGNIPNAIIIERNNHFIDGGIEIKIQSIDDGKKGIYESK
ncbi:hypothetical protein BH10BAC2_BH10BAC2_28460 [soil metagenome]